MREVTASFSMVVLALCATANADGSAWLTGDCEARMLRGDSWLNAPWDPRAAYRDWYPTGFRSSNDGFRVARPLAP